MKKIIFSIFLFFIFIKLSYANAANDFIHLLNNVQSMKANFTQTLYDNHGKLTQKSYGSMALQRPGKFRWDIAKPQPQLIIADQTKLWIYDADLEQLTIKKLNASTGDTPALLLSHDDSSIEKQYTIKAIQKANSTWQWFALTSKEKDSMFQSMQMGFLNNQIQEMRLQDNLGHVTIVQFKNIKINTALPASLFSIKPSSKVDVIDETRKKS